MGREAGSDSITPALWLPSLARSQQRERGFWPSVVDVVRGYVCYRIILSREACLSVLGFTSAGLGFGSLE